RFNESLTLILSRKPPCGAAFDFAAVAAAGSAPATNFYSAMDAVLQHTGEEHIRMGRLELAGCVQPDSQLGRDLEVQRGKIVVELCQLGGPADRGGDTGLRRHPVERDLRGRTVQ